MYPDRGDQRAPQERSVTGSAGLDPAGLDPAGVDPAGVDPAGVDPAGVDPAGQPDDDALARLYPWPAAPAGTDRSVVRANMIASLEGGTTFQGRSAGLGNPADERLFALLRDLAEVILVGAGTVRAEQYGGVRLTEERTARRVRWGLPAAPPPIAVVTGRGMDPLSPLFTDTVTPPIVITTAAGATDVPAGIDVITSATDRVDLTGALLTLRQKGFRRVHCEGGPALLAALVAEDLLDELCLTISPVLLGTGSRPLLPAVLDEPARWALRGVHIGGDHLFTRYGRRAVPVTPDRFGVVR